jgi:hypothetical protein
VFSLREGRDFEFDALDGSITRLNLPFKLILHLFAIIRKELGKYPLTLRKLGLGYPDSSNDKKIDSNGSLVLGLIYMESLLGDGGHLNTGS